VADDNVTVTDVQLPSVTVNEGLVVVEIVFASFAEFESTTFVAEPAVYAKQKATGANVELIATKAKPEPHDVQATKILVDDVVPVQVRQFATPNGDVATPVPAVFAHAKQAPDERAYPVIHAVHVSVPDVILHAEQPVQATHAGPVETDEFNA